MIDEDDASHSCHEHGPDTTILESKEIVDNNEVKKKKKKKKKGRKFSKKSKLSIKSKLSPQQIQVYPMTRK